MEERIRKAVGEVLSMIGAGDVSFVVERPSDFAHGDYATNAALAATKELGKKPHEIAEKLTRPPSMQASITEQNGSPRTK